MNLRRRWRRSFPPTRTSADKARSKKEKLKFDHPLIFSYQWFIDLLLAELCLPRDWHRALFELPFKNSRNTIHGASLRRNLTLCLKGFIMNTGTVKWFNSTKGFGFIQPDNGGDDAFVHISAVERAGMRDIFEGQKIGYDLERDNKSGKMSACNLQAA